VNLAAPGAPRCANCGTAALGAWCHACGQRIGLQRLTLRQLLHDVPQVLFSVERGLWATLRGLARRPGATIDSYLDGQRVRWVNPLALLSLLAGVMALVLSLLPVPATPGLAGMAPEMAARYASFNRLTWTYYGASMLLFVPAYAAITRLVFTGFDRHYGEHLALNAFILSGTTLLTLVLMVPMTLSDPQGPARTLTGAAVLVLVHLFHAWALQGCFSAPGRRWAATWRAVLATVLCVAFSAAVTLAFFFAVYARL
jgi:hypothetical protein